LFKRFIVNIKKNNSQATFFNKSLHDLIEGCILCEIKYILRIWLTVIEQCMLQDDNFLIQQILSGNQEAEWDLYKQHERYWFRVCLRYGASRSEAQDILQEGLISIYSSLPQFDIQRGTFKSWSNRVIVNSALRFLKKNSWQKSFEELEEASEEIEISEGTLDKIAVKELTELVQRLPIGYRLVFNLYSVEGYKHQEIAEQLGITVGTSKSQLSKAKKALRQRLEILDI